MGSPNPWNEKDPDPSGDPVRLCFTPSRGDPAPPWVFIGSLLIYLPDFYFFRRRRSQTPSECMAKPVKRASSNEPGGSNIDTGLHRRFGLECASRDVSVREWVLEDKSGRHDIFDIEFVVEEGEGAKKCPLCNLIFARLPCSRNLRPALLHGTQASVVFEEHGSQERIFVRLFDKKREAWTTYGRIRKVSIHSPF
jgi:hypothetical protein